MAGGTTYLDVKERDGIYVVSFSATRGGASRWAYITDALDDAIQRLRLVGLDPSDIKFLDAGRRLGQGARLRMSRVYFFALLGIWMWSIHVLEALEDSSLVVKGAVPANWQTLALRLVGPYAPEG